MVSVAALEDGVRVLTTRRARASCSPPIHAQVRPHLSLPTHAHHEVAANMTTHPNTIDVD